MDRHSVDPDPGLNYSAVILHFKMEKKKYIAAVQIVARLRIVNARWYSSFD